MKNETIIEVNAESAEKIVNETFAQEDAKMEESKKLKTKLWYIWMKRINSSFKIAIQTLVILALMYGAFLFGTVYNDLVKREVIIERQVVKKIGETSVAINERSELMILDRNTGNYQVYQDSVGISIFWLYARQLHDQLK